MAGLPLVTLSNSPQMRRKIRRPVHNWQVRVPPYCFQITTMAPVLPGETLEEALLQVRAVSDPVVNPLLGWHLCYYLFYVPFSAMADRANIRSMLISGDITALTSGEGTKLSHYMGDDTAGANGYDWVDQCEVAIVNRFFRDEIENEGFATVDSDSTFTESGSGWYKAKAKPPGWMDSMIKQGDLDTLDVTITDTSGADTVMASEIETAMRQYEILRQGGLTTQTYEEYLMTYGVRVEMPQDEKYPELLRKIEAWQYPSNTVEPTTGVPSSALSWALAERVDKKRFFKEPGFLCWGTVAKPKVYFAKQTSFAAFAQKSVYTWLPATMREDKRIALRPLNIDTVVKDITGGVYVDYKDLFMYGDQFVNYAMTDTASGMVNLPELASSTGINREYIPDADLKALFVTSASKYYVRQDGVCHFAVAGTVEDTSPSLIGMV